MDRCAHVDLPASLPNSEGEQHIARVHAARLRLWTLRAPRSEIGRVKIVLAQAPHRDTFGYSMPPPGLLRLGGELTRAGIVVALEDLAYRLAAGELALDDELAQRAALLLLERARGAANGADSHAERAADE